MKEIAKLAGVSISTVSRVLNSEHNDFASVEVRDRIWGIVKETGYVPNPHAKRLRGSESEQKTSNTLACIFGHTKTPADNPFFAEIARSIEQHALQLNYIISNSYSLYDVTDYRLLHKKASAHADGAIILGKFSPEKLRFIEKQYKDIVYTGLNGIEAHWDQIICDGYQATKTAVSHLIGLGHSLIAYLGNTEDKVLYTAYLDTMKEAGIDFDPSLVVNCSLNGNGGYLGMQTLLEQAETRPTAVFCGNDIAAIAGMRRLIEYGLRIPQDISVIGMDDIELTQFTSPMLTTIHIPKEELGQIAVHVLISRIEKKHRLPMKIILPHELLIRESTGKVCKK